VTDDNRRTGEAAAARPSSASPGLLAGMMTAAAIGAQVYPDLVEHVPGLITEGFGILAGAPKTGKSWLGLDVALACAEGGIALGGLPVDQRSVLLLALEDGPRRLQSRMRQLRGGMTPLPNSLDICTEVTPGTVAATISEWMCGHAGDRHKPLVVLDTLGCARPQRRAGDDPYIADYQLGRGIKRLVDQVPGAGLLAVHHTRKQGAQDWMDTVSGTQGIVGSADYVLVLRRERQSNDGLLSVTGRDVTENEYALAVTAGRWSLDGPDLDAAAESARSRTEAAREQKQSRLADRSLSALTYVQSRKETAPKDLAAYLKVSPQTAATTLGRLVDKNLIVKSAYGHYSPIPTPDKSVVPVVSVVVAGQTDKTTESPRVVSVVLDQSVVVENSPSPGTTTTTTGTTPPTPSPSASPSSMPSSGSHPALITSHRHRRRERQQTREAAS
jgi:AAA domain